MTHAKLILIIGILYAFLITPWWAGLIIGILNSLTACLVVDLIAWAVKKWMRDDHN